MFNVRTPRSDVEQNHPITTDHFLQRVLPHQQELVSHPFHFI